MTERMIFSLFPAFCPGLGSRLRVAAKEPYRKKTKAQQSSATLAHKFC